jgi:COP9 signalosome complex subunit 4
LANAGPQRARMLATLYKDERVEKLAPQLYQLLERVFLDRILDPKAVAAFAQTLKPHQLALLGDGKSFCFKFD